MGQGEFLGKDAYSYPLDFELRFSNRLSPTQTEGIPAFQSKTPVAQMHFASELHLSQGSHSINGKEMIIH
jgi:hypothetical protein